MASSRTESGSEAMKYLRAAASYSLYWLGHVVSRLDRFDSERLTALWYPVYNRLMNWSANIQGASDLGPWAAVRKLI